MRKIRKIPTERETLDQIRIGKLWLPPLSFRLLQEESDLGGIVKFDALVEASWSGKTGETLTCQPSMDPKNPKTGSHRFPTIALKTPFQHIPGFVLQVSS